MTNTININNFYHLLLAPTGALYVIMFHYRSAAAQLFHSLGHLWHIFGPSQGHLWDILGTYLGHLLFLQFILFLLFCSLKSILGFLLSDRTFSVSLVIFLVVLWCQFKLLVWICSPTKWIMMKFLRWQPELLLWATLQDSDRWVLGVASAVYRMP